MYNLGFRVLLRRLCADIKDFYDLLAQPDNYLPLSPYALKRKQSEKLRSDVKVHPSPRLF